MAAKAEAGRPDAFHPAMIDRTETIAAVATAIGPAGIGVVRLSGADALTVALNCFRPVSPGNLPPPSRKAVLGSFLAGPGTDDPDRVLDQVLLTYFPAPRSYTGEEQVEISCHGSPLILRRVLGALLRSGARLAEPGEFTQRAFLNGKLDLAAAEAVSDVIHAGTDAALRVAQGQLAGRLSQETAELRRELIGMLAEIEAGIDFPDEIGSPEDAEIARRAQAVRTRLQRLLATAEAGRIYREGAAVVLAGRPNVGKSSLLNALLRSDRAIVTDVPGTTRDTLEEPLNLGGVPVRAIDTAGLRETEDPVESAGIRRSWDQVGAADLVVWVVEPGLLPEPDLRLAERLSPGRLVVAANKSDLGVPDITGIHAAVGRTVEVVPVSAQTGDGLDRLERVLADLLTGGVGPEEIWVSRLRHQQRLEEARAAVIRAIEAAAAGFDQAAVALDLRLATEALGEITGESVVEATISEIFRRFCVGK